MYDAKMIGVAPFMLCSQYMEAIVDVVAIELIVTCSSALSGSVIVVLALVFVIMEPVALRKQPDVTI